MEISLTELLSGPLVIAIRISGLMLFAPFFGNNAIPPRIKAMLVMLITAVLYPVYSAQVGIVTLAQWPGVVAREFVLGVAIGVATNFVFEAAQMAGSVLGVQMGYSLVNILDPQTQVDTTVVAMFHQSVAFLLFLQLDVHHWILRGIAHSFEYLSPGAVHLNRGLTTRVAAWSGGRAGNRGSDRRACTGGNSGGGCDSGISRKGLATNALDVAGSGTQKHVGRRTLDDRDPLLAGSVSNVTSRNLWDSLNVFCTWRRGHER